MTPRSRRIVPTLTAIALTASAKSVTALARSIRVAGDELTYTVRMAAVGLCGLLAGLLVL